MRVIGVQPNHVNYLVCHSKQLLMYVMQYRVTETVNKQNCKLNINK